jgi:hypothetical protein
VTPTQIDLALWILSSALRLAWVWLALWAIIESGWLVLYAVRRLRK